MSGVHGLTSPADAVGAYLRETYGFGVPSPAPLPADQGSQADRTGRKGPRLAGGVIGAALFGLDRAAREELNEKAQAVARHAEARRRAAEVLTLSVSRWTALEAIRTDFAAANERGDEEAVAELIEYATEILFEPDAGPDTAPDDEILLDEIALADRDEAAEADRVERERSAFFDRYFAAKAKAGLETQSEVAKRAGLSPTTVNAIETRRVWPQFRTVKKLAKAFETDAAELMGRS